mgnify:CR=1 FL=1
MTYALKADSVALTTMINKLSSGCKPEQIIRELWMNALEAIVRGTPPGQEPKGEILITRDKERPLKAVFCNSDADPLTKQVVGRHLLSLGSSGNSNTDNFGIGAKIAYLPRNTLGLMYRCREEMMQFQFGRNNDNIFSLIPEPVDIVDEEDNVTGTQMEDFVDISLDEFTMSNSETEVLLLGSTEEEDTWKQLCAVAGVGDGRTDPFSGHTIADWLEQRIWNLPYPGIKTHVSIYNEAGEEVKKRLLRPLKDVIHSDTYPVNGVTELSSGVKVHYFAKRFESGKKVGDRRRAGYLGIALGGETYVDTAISPTARQRYMSQAGVYTHYKHVGLYFELPDKLGFCPEPSRCRVSRNGDDFPLSDYAEEFRNKMPDNLKQWMSELHTPHNSTIQDEMNKLFRATPTASSTQETSSSRKTSPTEGLSPNQEKRGTSANRAPRRRKKVSAAGMGTNKTSTAPEYVLQNNGSDSPAVIFDTVNWIVTVNQDSALFSHRVAKLAGWKATSANFVQTAVGETMYESSCRHYIDVRDAYRGSKSIEAIHRDMEEKFDACYDETRAKYRLSRAMTKIQRTEAAAA